MWWHPLAATLASLAAIPVSSLLLHPDPGGAWAGASGGYMVPPGAGGGEVRAKEIYTYKHYLIKDCSHLYKESSLELNTSNNFFKGGDGDDTFYREYTCKDETIVSIDREYDSDVAPVISSAFWINAVWSDLHLEGKCVQAAKGGIRFEPPLPEDGFSSLECLATPEYEVSFYSDAYCSSMFPTLMQSMKTHASGDCVDIVDINGRRKGQKYECVDHALVERTYGDYLACNEKSFRGGEDVWTYARWKSWVTGSCVSFDKLVSGKLSGQAISDEVIEAMEATECGSPMAELIFYTAPGCDEANALLHQDLVAENEDCVFMTSHRARRSVRLAKACGEDSYSLFAYPNNRCSFIPYWGVKLTGEEHGRFLAEECIETSEVYAGIPVFFKLVVLNRERPPFQTSVSTCTTTTTATDTTATDTTATDTTATSTETTVTTASSATTTTEEPVKAPPPPEEWEPPPEWEKPPPEYETPPFLPSQRVLPPQE